MPSSVIRAFYYKVKTHQLFISFVSGKQYRYDRVPELLSDRFGKAFSKGSFFNQYIKDRYPFSEL